MAVSGFVPIGRSIQGSPDGTLTAYLRLPFGSSGDSSFSAIGLFSGAKPDIFWPIFLPFLTMFGKSSDDNGQSRTTTTKMQWSFPEGAKPDSDGF